MYRHYKYGGERACFDALRWWPDILLRLNFSKSVMSFKEVRDALVWALADDVIDEDAFLVLYESRVLCGMWLTF